VLLISHVNMVVGLFCSSLSICSCSPALSTSHIIRMGVPPNLVPTDMTVCRLPLSTADFRLDFFPPRGCTLGPANPQNSQGKHHIDCSVTEAYPPATKSTAEKLPGRPHITCSVWVQFPSPQNYITRFNPNRSWKIFTFKYANTSKCCNEWLFLSYFLHNKKIQNKKQEVLRRNCRLNSFVITRTGSRESILTTAGIRCADHATFFIRKSLH
jgi:hypothetical protein